MKVSFYDNILKMFVGTTGAYVFWALAMLVVGRLYTPEYLGGGQLFISATSMLSVIATARYEKALMLPRFHFQAIQLFLFSVLLSFICTLGMILAIVFFRNEFVAVTGIELENINILPFYLLELCLYVLFYAWVVRTKKYRVAARGLVLFPLGYLGFSVMFYFIELPLHKLILALILARGMEVLYYGYYLYKDIIGYMDKVVWQSVFRQGREYADFPKYVLAGSLVETAAVHTVPFLVTVFWGLEATGYYPMSMQVLAAPTGLIAKAVGDVFRQEGASLFGKNKECTAFYQKNLRLCTAYSAIVCCSIYVIVPLLLPMVLGEKWDVAGEYVQYMVPMTFAMLISIPLLDMYNIARQQQKYLAIQMAFLASSALGIGITGQMGCSIKMALIVWGGLVVVVSGVSIYGGWKIAKGTTS